jgi:hypothetical protein
VINYRHHSWSLIYWLYLHHRFLQAYLSQYPLPSEAQDKFKPPQSSVESSQHLTDTLSNALDCELLNFGAATLRLEETITRFEVA